MSTFVCVNIFLCFEKKKKKTFGNPRDCWGIQYWGRPGSKNFEFWNVNLTCVNVYRWMWKIFVVWVKNFIEAILALSTSHALHKKQKQKQKKWDKSHRNVTEKTTHQKKNKTSKKKIKKKKTKSQMLRYRC